MSEDIRVLNCLSDPRMGGPQRQALLNATGLRKSTNVETEFLLPEGPDDFEEHLLESGFTVHRPELRRLYPPQYLYKNVCYIGSFPTAVYRIKRLIQIRNIDIVHVNSPMNLYAAIAGWLSNAKVLWHFHGYNFPTVLMRGIRLIAPILSDDFIFPSSVAKREIFNEEVDGTIIFPPVDVAKFNRNQVQSNKTLHAELGVNEEVPIAGAVGNINPAKDYELLLHSVRNLVDKGFEIAVPIIGGVSDTKETYFEELCDLRDELNLRDYIFFLGWRSDIRDLLYNFDFFVLSSKMETGPMSLMEAMAMELPFVTTRVGIVNDIDEIEEIGWVVPPQSKSRFTHALELALDFLKVREGICTRARECSKRYFSLEQSISKHKHLYNDLMNT